jgi:hypothetical protein
MGHTRAQIQLRGDYAALLDTCDACVSSATWHAKMRLVSFSQVSLFANLFDVPKDRALSLLRPLLLDEHVEVGVCSLGLCRQGLRAFAFVIERKEQDRYVVACRVFFSFVSLEIWLECKEAGAEEEAGAAGFS